MPALFPASAFAADCKSDPSSFRVCPNELPPIPDYQLLCEAGCYLFDPADEREARFNRDRVLEIPKLKLAIERLTGAAQEARDQRDLALEDAATFRGLAERTLADNERLKTDLDAAYTSGDLAVTFFAGIGGGVLVTVLGIVVVVLVL